jgi:hypothetical protein
MASADRVELLGWIAEGPEKVVRSILEGVALDAGRVSQAEKAAAKLALDDLSSGRPCRNLLERVRVSEWETPEGGGPALGVVAKALFWDRPTSSVYATAFQALGGMLSSGASEPGVPSPKALQRTPPRPGPRRRR